MSVNVYLVAGRGLPTHDLRANGSSGKLTVSNVAVSFPSDEFSSGTTHVKLQCQDAPVRMSTNGNAPTTNNGLVLSEGDVIYLHIVEATTAQFIRDGGSDGVVYAQPLA